MNDARRTDALAVASLLLIVTIAFGDVLIGVNNFYMRDLTRYYYPAKQILRELIPDFETQAPLDTPVTADAVYFLTRENQFRLPVNPPFLRNHGNYIISLNRFVKWLGGLVEQAGVNIFAGFAGMEVLYRDGRVSGVRTDDKGIDRNGNPKSNFQPGYNLRAKVTVLAEGPRGSLTKQLIRFNDLDSGRNPQVYTVGVKELWDVPAGRRSILC